MCRSWDEGHGTVWIVARPVYVHNVPLYVLQNTKYDFPFKKDMSSMVVHCSQEAIVASHSPGVYHRLHSNIASHRAIALEYIIAM